MLQDSVNSPKTRCLASRTCLFASLCFRRLPIAVAFRNDVVWPPRSSEAHGLPPLPRSPTLQESRYSAALYFRCARVCRCRQSHLCSLAWLPPSMCVRFEFPCILFLMHCTARHPAQMAQFTALDWTGICFGLRRCYHRPHGHRYRCLR